LIAVYPGDIIPERWAKSSRNAERHQIGLAGDIIPDSRATSPGISIKIVDSQTLQVWRDDRWLQYGVPYPTEREAILEAFVVAAVADNNPPTTNGE